MVLSRKTRSGIALRETLIIAAMAIFLLLILVMWLGRTQGKSRQLLCEHRQRQTAAAIMQSEALHGHYSGYKNLQAIDADEQRQPTGWVFGLLPLLGYDVPPLEGFDEAQLRALAEDPEIQRPYAAIFQDYGPDGPDATRGVSPRERIVELICPDDPTRKGAEGDDVAENPMSWIVNTGMPDAEVVDDLPADWTANGIFENQFDAGAAQMPRIGAKWLSDHDGLASTLMLSENVGAGAWTNIAEALVGFVWVAEIVAGQPSPGERLLRINQLRGEGQGGMRFARPSSFHPGGVNVVYASGRSQFMSEGIDWLVFAQLMSSGGENAKLPGTETPVPEVYR